MHSCLSLVCAEEERDLGDTQTSEPGFPTDNDLLDALEEYEKQEQREAQEAVQAENTDQLAEGGSESANSHGRRRFLAGE